MQLTNLDPTHAAAAARLHIAGQPNTFLTNLGTGVLTTFYRALPQSPTGFGFAAVTDVSSASFPEPATHHSPLTTHHSPPATQLLGFVSATTSTGQLFLALGTRHLPAFLPPLLSRFAQRPGLLLNCMQTVFYPLLQSAAHEGEPTAELLSIMVEPAWRSQGIGAQLVARLVEECRLRTIAVLAVTVAAENVAARRFYARHGFVGRNNFRLYGRQMCSYQLQII
ncbi:MAG: GNAT family N-acetyltransferase [Caldilineaceae bacterium]